MSIIIKYTFTISCILIVSAIVRVLYKQRELAYVNPFFWMNVLSFAYFSLPCLLIEEISFYYNWNLTQISIDYTRVLISIINVLNTILLLLLKKVKLKPNINNSELNIFVKLLWFCIVGYLIAVLIKKICNNELFTYSMYGMKVYSDYKLKNLAYFILTFSTLLYFKTSNIISFLPNMLAFFLEICSGARTLSFVVVMPVFLGLAIKKKKTYLVPMVLMVLFFLSIGLARSFIIQDFNIPFYINIIGEFRETFITLPLFIQDNDFLYCKGSFIDLLGSIIGGMTPPPIRDYVLSYTIHPGRFIAVHIGRGYGLASNYLINSIFYGGYSFMIITYVFLIIIAFLFLNLIQKSNEKSACLLISFYLVFSRLAFREGIYANYSLMIFIMLFYGLPAYLIVNTRIVKEFLNKMIYKRLNDA